MGQLPGRKLDDRPHKSLAVCDWSIGNDRNPNPRPPFAPGCLRRSPLLQCKVEDDRQNGCAKGDQFRYPGRGDGQWACEN